jgi:hypothetical protein
VLLHARQVQQHREAGGSFDEGTVGGAIKAENEIPRPMTRYGTVVGFSGALADENLVSDEALGA